MNFLQSVFLTFVVASATRPKGSEQTTPTPTIPESTTPYGYYYRVRRAVYSNTTADPTGSCTRHLDGGRVIYRCGPTADPTTTTPPPSTKFI